VSERNVSFIVEGLYEVLKELLTALMLLNGLRSQNHQCLIAYFRQEFPEKEFESDLLGRLCYRRNRLNYYGELIEPRFYEKSEEAIEL